MRENLNQYTEYLEKPAVYNFCIVECHGRLYQRLFVNQSKLYQLANRGRNPTEFYHLKVRGRS